MSRPPHAEAARTLIAEHDQGALGTSDRTSAVPYTSVVEFACMPNGDPLLFVSSLAEHTQNFSETPGASLLVADDFGRPRPLERERVTIVGEIEPCESSRENLADRYLDSHPHAETYIDFDDFDFYRLVPERLRYIGGFGRMSWVDADAYREAEPDPIRLASAGIREHMNSDHDDALLAIARQLADFDWAARATLEEVDRYGFDLEVEDADGDRRDSARLAFDEPLEEPRDSRGAFTELAELARSAASD